MMKKTTRNIGQEAESCCCDYLQKQGLNLIEKNFHCRFGEIDLVMKENNTIVFIEVRYRKNNHFGGAAASVTPAKQKKVRTSAESYLQINAIKNNARIDVVAMTENPDNVDGFSFNWIKNAF